jgi:putative ABC transport system permease protein
MQRISELSRVNHRILSGVLSLLAAIALFLSAIGLYGVTAFGIAQRTSEIGVRIALGAARRQLTWQFVRRTLAQVAMGLTLGLAGAMALGQVISGFLIGTTALDPVTFATVMALIAAVTLIACLIPATRAMRLDPVAALRRE